MLSAPTVPDIPGSSRTAQRALHLTTSILQTPGHVHAHSAARPSHAQILGYARCACRMYAISGTPPPPPPPPQVSPETHLTLHMKICGPPVPGPRDGQSFYWEVLLATVPPSLTRFWSCSSSCFPPSVSCTELVLRPLTSQPLRNPLPLPSYSRRDCTQVMGFERLHAGCKCAQCTRTARVCCCCA